MIPGLFYGLSFECASVRRLKAVEKAIWTVAWGRTRFRACHAWGWATVMPMQLKPQNVVWSEASVLVRKLAASLAKSLVLSLWNEDHRRGLDGFWVTFRNLLKELGCRMHSGQVCLGEKCVLDIEWKRQSRWLLRVFWAKKAGVSVPDAQRIDWKTIDTTCVKVGKDGHDSARTMCTKSFLSAKSQWEVFGNIIPRSEHCQRIDSQHHSMYVCESMEAAKEHATLSDNDVTYLNQWGPWWAERATLLNAGVTRHAACMTWITGDMIQRLTVEEGSEWQVTIQTEAVARKAMPPINLCI